jgi:phosphohistidine swiveling domain-containing protein
MTPAAGMLPLSVRPAGPDAEPSGSTPTGAAGLLGGKGASLGRLIAAGLPVPPCEVLTTAAYRQAVRAPGLSQLLDDLARGREVPDEEIDRQFLTADPPEPVLAAIAGLLDRVGGGGAVAVRSSATTEDLEGASFAGQYRSVLEVADDAALLDALRLVWASLWHRAPRTYRQFHGFHDEVAMAVVVMAMVPARRAGVAFTRDPGGSSDRVRVESVDGLAEGLVSGAATPRCYLLARDDPGQPHAPPPMAEVGRLALRCEELFGTPQDVEWAWDGARVWLVQSRPITTAAAAVEDDGFDSAVGRSTRYTTAGIGEMLPGVLPVLRWSSVSFLIEEGFRHVCDELRAAPADAAEAEHFVVRVRGRSAMNLDALTAVATALPTGTPQELENQYFGAEAGEPAAGDEGEVQPRASRWRVPGPRELAHDVRVVFAHRRARREAAVVDRAATAVLDNAPDLSTLGDADLLALRARVLDLAARTMTAELAVAAAAAAAYGRLEGTLRRHLGASGSSWAQLSTRSVGAHTVVARAAALGHRIAGRCPEALAVPDWPEARCALSEAGLADEVVDLARRAGSRSVFAGPTWDEDLAAMWALVRAGAARQGPAAADWELLAQMEQALVSQPGWRRTRILTGQVVDVRLHMVRALLAEATELLTLREEAKSAVLSLGGVVRRIEQEAGRRLADRGLLADPADTEHLTPAELRAALLEERGPAADVVDARRRLVARWQQEDELPLLFTGRPGRTLGDIPAGQQLSGWGASGGRHTGPVRVLTEPDESVVERGDIVVARRTDAAWSPVFLKAGAIVVEQGGPLSHAAIVARELGLPAVVNVPGAVARLRAPDVTVVSVDGDSGLVVIPAPATPVAEVSA